MNQRKRIRRRMRHRPHYSQPLWFRWGDVEVVADLTKVSLSFREAVLASSVPMPTYDEIISKYWRATE